MRTNLLLFILLVLAGSLSAQDNLPPVYEIRTDTAVKELPDAFWDMLEDTAGSTTFADVRRPDLAQRFHPNNTETTRMGYSGVRHYWQRFRLRNGTGKEIQLVFHQLPNPFRFQLHVLRSSGSTQHLINGWGVPYAERDSFKRSAAVPLRLAAGEEVTIYREQQLFRLEKGKKLKVSFSFYDPYVKEVYVAERLFSGDVRNAFIAGLLLFGFFLNIFFYSIVKEKVYFYYALVLLLEGAWYLFTGTEVFFRKTPYLVRYIDMMFTFLLFFCLVTQFVRHFLKTFIYYPRWDRLILSLTAGLVIWQVVVVVIEPKISYSMRGIPVAVSNLFLTSLMLVLLLTFLFPKKEKDRFTTLSVVAAIPAFVMWSFVYGLNSLYRFLVTRYEQPPLPFFQWLDQYTNIIEMFCVAWFTLLFTWILLQRYALLRKAFTQQALARERERNELMNRQNEELEKQVEERTAALKRSLEELQTTQKQLIQSEKMASLGELTAGIAHEIQNPLNFINNFSELNTELIDEMKSSMATGNQEEFQSLADTVTTNLEKIVYHGKRADGIVKSMLQHSRASLGVKEPTDINALAEEFLRLSYHGLRAKDKSFNATLKSEFDPAVEKVPVIAQDIGRVLLNIFNNAFYSVTEKKKRLNGTYDPRVEVKTKKEGDRVVIRIRDNGMGIPQKVLDKIYQPFFTTKPSGEGTGLGLSLSYDIITKGHGGTLQAVSKEGEFTEFLILLPVQQNLAATPETKH